MEPIETGVEELPIAIGPPVTSTDGGEPEVVEVMSTNMNQHVPSDVRDKWYVCVGQMVRTVSEWVRT